VPGDVVSARLYVSARGLFEVELNGQRVGEDHLTPGWTSYDNRLRYFTYDVTPELSPGANVLGIWLADGWYRGRLGYRGDFDVYGKHIAVIAQLEIQLASGESISLATDENWEWKKGPIRFSDLYDGERYELEGNETSWSSPTSEDQTWSPVAISPRGNADLIAPEGPAVRRQETLKPISVMYTAAGSAILDFGQNVVGRLRISPQGPRGLTVRMRHAEALEADQLARRPLRSAEAEDTYVHDGVSTSWEPRFTIHGFRYAELIGWRGLVVPEQVVACVYHTDMPRTGEFECSNDLVNRLHQNTVWSMRGNFVDIPTDCPQRDERLGWTGDIQVFAPTAAFLYDCAPLLSSWLRDLALEQYDDGVVPWVIPQVPGPDLWKSFPPIAVWGDAAVLVPWTLYEFFGDVDVLRRQYKSAQKWVELVWRLAGDSLVWSEGFQLGDWLDPFAPPESPQDSRTDAGLVATAYFARSAGILAQMAHVLHLNEDHRRYSSLSERVARAFRSAYLGEDGRLLNETQTSYALGICFGLYVDDRHKLDWGTRLAEIVRTSGHTIETGFAGTPLICEALTAGGHVADAYSLLLQTRYPSWLHPILLGATTIWERWDSMTSDRRVNPGSMTSFNHYALGSVSDWLHTTVAGLRPLEPGFKSILFRPRLDPRITSAHASHKTPYGQAAIHWQVLRGTLEVAVEVPHGSVGVIDIEGHEPKEVGPGAHHLEFEYQVARLEQSA
jgi:alpha-L-rhamnosidase